MKKILICGASGFIGRNVFKFLTATNEFEVHGTCLNNEHLHPHLKKVDLINRRSVKEITKGYDCVINAAAITAGSGAVAANPHRYITDNLLINSHLTEAVHENNVGQFIFLSCTVMYPSSDRPLAESEYDLSALHPRYRMGARLKVFGEDLCRFYAGLEKTRYTSIRHSNVYGPYDKFDLEKAHVFGATVTKVMTSDGKVVVWGNGQEQRNLLHVHDLVRFIRMVIDGQDYPYDVFNVGSSTCVSVQELTEKIIAVSGRNLSIVYDQSRPSIDISIQISSKKAEKKFGWKSKINLDAGIKTTLDWYRQLAKQLPIR